MNDAKFRAIKSKISELPFPIANVYHRYLSIPADHLSERHSVLADLFEALLKFVSILGLQDAIASESLAVRIFPNGFEFLRHPSLGHWISILRDISRHEENHTRLLQSKISSWYNSSINDRALIQLYDNLPEISFPSYQSGIASICSSLVTYRNKVWRGHGASILKEETLKRRVGALEGLLAYLLNSMDFWDGFRIFWVSEVKILEKDSFDVSCILLMGNARESDSFLSNRPIDRNEIYISNKTLVNKESCPIKLSPLVEWQPNQNGDYQFYFFNDAQRTKLEYLSYTDGSFYYHREIKKELEKLLNINIDEKQKNYEHIVYNFSEEERKDKSNDFYLQGLELAAQGQFENAIIAFEDSLEWYKRPDSIVEKCKAMQALREDSSYVEKVLEQCFELDANYIPAIELQTHLLEETDIKVDEDRRHNELENNLTYFNFFLPNKLKSISALFWFSALSFFFSFSLVIMYLTDPKYSYFYLPVAAIFLAKSLIMIFGVSLARNKYNESYFGLLGQLDNVNSERFKNWFQYQYSKLFGNFAKTGKSFHPYYSEERGFLLFAGLFTISWCVASIFLQQIFNLPFLIGLAQFLDTALVWLLVTPAIRFVIYSTLFIRDYSNFSLNPVISKTANSGFRKIISIYCQNLMLLDVFWILTWLWNYLLMRDLYIDFIGLFFGLSVVIFWTIISPMFILRAIKLSKSIATMTYQSHIKQAFKKFIKSPDELALEKLEWLLKNENKVAKISTRVFSLSQLFFVLVSNILVIGTSILYVLLRLKIIELALF